MQNQVPSPHLLEPPAADRLTFSHASNPPEPPPHMAAELQATPPHQFNPVHPQSFHLRLPPINPPHLNGPQMSSPVSSHPYITSSLEPQLPLTSPPFARQAQPSSAELLCPPQQVYGQNTDSDWTRSSELSYPWRSDTFSYQVRLCSATKTEKNISRNVVIKLQKIDLYH